MDGIHDQEISWLAVGREGTVEGINMPAEEIFLKLEHGGTAIRVLKTYDAAFAREVFEGMDSTALKVLWDSLALKDNYDAADIPAGDSPDFLDFIWEELLDGAREDGQARSFFVVLVGSNDAHEKAQFVSGDWPTAQDYAKQCIESAPTLK
jgi:hypothetical protein